MQTSLVQSLLVLTGLVLAAAAQDMLPAFGGAKAPLVQTLALYVALDGPGAAPLPAADGREGRGAARRPGLWMATAVLAGCLLDALSGLPFGCGAGFLLPACAVARLVRRVVAGLPPAALGLAAAMVAAPLNELWLNAWGVTGGDPALVRFFASALPAAGTGALLFTLLPRVARAAGLCGEEARA